MKKVQLIIILLFSSAMVFGQSKKGALYFDKPILADSSSTLMIPIKYNESLFSSSKISFWGNYYANILFYNFLTDSYKKLFENNTYIVGFSEYYSYAANRYENSVASKVLLFKVRNVDRNGNNKIDDKDPTILYVSDKFGNNLKKITSDSVNVISIDLYDKQNFALIKVQSDKNNDNYFDDEDTDYYYIKLDLINLRLGNKIELK